MKASQKRIFIIVCGVALIGLLAAFAWFGQQLRQKQLDRDLISALKKMDTRTAIHLLNEGANANATNRETPEPTLQQRLSDIVDNIQGVKRQSPWNTTMSDATPAIVLVCQQSNPGEARHFREALPVLETLLKHGANVNATDPSGETALNLAVFNHDVEAARLLLENHANPDIKNSQGYPPLLLADGDIARLLVAHGANVNARDNNGETALIMSAERRDTALALLELQKGADVNASDNMGRTALMLGSTIFSPAMMRLLLDHGADINARDKEGNSALMFAVSGQEPPEEIQLFLARGADPNIENRNGKTALDNARQSGNTEAVPLLEAAMKK